jgi:teichuronic acid biosynthesis glycosyltransferase TuaG
MLKPEVSVIMPVYNASEFLLEAIHSVQMQTFTNWELIIVDDCSIDNSFEIIKRETEDDDRIRSTRRDENCGAASARNLAIDLANGRYIAFLDSDDIWCPTKLEQQLGLLQSSGAAVCFTSYSKIVANGKLTGRAIEAKSVVNYKMILRSNYIGLSTSVYDTNKCGKVFMLNCRMHEDYSIWLRILRRGHIAVGLKEVLTYYRVGENSLSSNKLKAAFYHWKVLRSTVGPNIFYTLFLFMNYVWHGVRKYYT